MTDHLEHYGVPGMKWGKRRNATIKDARARQRVRKDEIKGLKKEKLRAQTDAGRKHLDKVIKEKKIVLKEGGDASIAKKSTVGVLFLKGTAGATLMASTAAAVHIAVQVGKFAGEVGTALSESDWEQ